MTDKRALIVELTEQGENFQLQKPDYDEIFVELSFEEKKILKQTMEKIALKLNELIKEELEDEFY